jgi:hypothetical protein
MTHIKQKSGKGFDVDQDQLGGPNMFVSLAICHAGITNFLVLNQSGAW